MSEAPKPVLFDFQELVTEMVRKKGIHTGIWALFVEFGLTAGNMGFRNDADPNAPSGPSAGPPDYLLPTAIVPIKQIGLIPAPVISHLAVDASIVNPKAQRKTARKTPKKKA